MHKAVKIVLRMRFRYSWIVFVVPLVAGYAFRQAYSEAGKTSPNRDQQVKQSGSKELYRGRYNLLKPYFWLLQTKYFNTPHHHPTHYHPD